MSWFKAGGHNEPELDTEMIGLRHTLYHSLLFFF